MISIINTVELVTTTIIMRPAAAPEGGLLVFGFRLTKPVSHPPSRGGLPPSAAGLRWIVKKKKIT